MVVIPLPYTTKKGAKMTKIETINTHQLPHSEDGNNGIHILVADEKGAGGANHEYKILLLDKIETTNISFQNGTVLENGTNGITMEALLAICAHRLEGFQSGNFPSVSNQVALDYINAAIASLQSRTMERINRGVKGLTVA